MSKTFDCEHPEGDVVQVCASCLVENMRKRTVALDADPTGETLPEVGGDRLAERTLVAFERAAKHCLKDEQEKIAPDNALIAVLCDAVRLARENHDMWKQSLETSKLLIDRAASSTGEATGSERSRKDDNDD